MSKIKDYIRSLPVRILAAIIMLVVLFSLGLFDKKEEPAPHQQSGILNTYQESTEQNLRVMDSRPTGK